jgi:3-deoxy-manno-octulosonate cytidylyltransferase (CMP-KDO synthetase)
MRTIAVIPARYRSNRLPGKPLKDIHGKTMIERVYQRVLKARLVDEVLVATDDERIRDAVAGFGGRAVLTSVSHPTGSDRIAEVVADLDDVDLVVNVQGDEPLVAPDAVDDAVRLARETPGAIVTLRREIVDRESLFDPNVVKVVTDLRDFALYFSRSPIPAPPEGPVESDGPDPLPRGLYFKHVGLYVYPRGQLLALARTPPVPLELAEKLEQLRALAHGVPIRLRDTEHEFVAVDTEADLERVRALVGASERSTVMNRQS